MIPLRSFPSFAHCRVASAIISLLPKASSHLPSNLTSPRSTPYAPSTYFRYQHPFSIFYFYIWSDTFGLTPAGALWNLYLFDWQSMYALGCCRDRHQRSLAGGRHLWCVWLPNALTRAPLPYGRDNTRGECKPLLGHLWQHKWFDFPSICVRILMACPSALASEPIEVSWIPYWWYPTEVSRWYHGYHLKGAGTSVVSSQSLKPLVKMPPATTSNSFAFKYFLIQMLPRIMQ